MKNYIAQIRQVAVLQDVCGSKCYSVLLMMADVNGCMVLCC